MRLRRIGSYLSASDPLVRQPWVVPALLGLGILVAERAAALFGASSALLALGTVLVAPGAAASPLLPKEFAGLATRVAITPPLSLMLSSILLVSMGATGVPLNSNTVWAGLFALVLAAVLLSALLRGTRESAGVTGLEVGYLIVLAAALCAMLAFQTRLVQDGLFSGEDWGKYMLYINEIVRHHSLDLTNPFWMQGVPFRDDPGAPALGAGYLLLCDCATASSLPIIWLFSLCVALAIFAAARVLWGLRAAAVATVVYAVTPMTFDMLAWYGLANTLALVFLPLCMAAVGMMLRGDESWCWSVLLGLGLVAMGAAHRLSLLLTLVALAFIFVIFVFIRAVPTIILTARTAILGLIVGAGVIVDGVDRASGGHGVQTYSAYAVTRIKWSFVVRDLTWPFLIAGLAGLTLLAIRAMRRNDGAAVVPVMFALALLAVGYSWLVHIPVAYGRITFYLPVVLALAVGAASGWLRAPLALLIVVGVVITMAIQTDRLIPGFRGFYSYATPAALHGLSHVEATTTRRDTIVTDACWAFLSEWLLQRRTLAALDRSQILFAEELAPAQRARRILDGGRDGSRLARTLGVRYALVDPRCTHDTGVPYAPPKAGRPVFLSDRLVVLDLG
jgi:hypothetical protein